MFWLEGTRLLLLLVFIYSLIQVVKALTEGPVEETDDV